MPTKYLRLNLPNKTAREAHKVIRVATFVELHMWFVKVY